MHEMQMVEPDPGGEALTRSYDVDKFLVSSADMVCRLHRQTTSNILEIGRRLLAVKPLLGHGNFGTWVRTECGFTERTASRYMDVARKLDGKSDTLSDLTITVVPALTAPEKSREPRKRAITHEEDSTAVTAHPVEPEPGTAKVTPNSTVLPPSAAIEPTIDKAVRTARQKLIDIVVRAMKDSPDKAVELARRAELPDLECALVEFQMQREQDLAEFKAKQLTLFPWQAG